MWYCFCSRCVASWRHSVPSPSACSTSIYAQPFAPYIHTSYNGRVCYIEIQRCTLYVYIVYVYYMNIFHRGFCIMRPLQTLPFTIHSFIVSGTIWQSFPTSYRCWFTETIHFGLAAARGHYNCYWCSCDSMRLCITHCVPTFRLYYFTTHTHMPNNNQWRVYSRMCSLYLSLHIHASHPRYDMGTRAPKPTNSHSLSVSA